jgi:Fe-S cluster biogenesis protein NfuA
MQGDDVMSDGGDSEITEILLDERQCEVVVRLWYACIWCHVQRVFAAWVRSTSRR